MIVSNVTDFPTVFWDEWSGQIIAGMGLKKTSNGEYHGACPNCGGHDRFWIKNSDGRVVVHCRQCEDFKAITEALRDHGLWPEKTAQNGSQSLTGSVSPFLSVQAYHQRKKIGLNGAELIDGKVKIPIYNAERQLIGHQTIAADGTKRFTPGMESKGAFGVVGGILGDHAYVTEGWADAATLSEATGKAAIFGLSASNMIEAIRSIQEVRPDIQLTVAADNDEVGIAAAKKIHKELGIEYVLPRRKDFNDVLLNDGKQAVLEDLENYPERADPFACKLDLDTLKPIEFVVDGFLSCGLTTIAGAPGVGKTSVLVPLCAAISGLIDTDLTIRLRRKVIFITEAPEQAMATLYGLRTKIMSAKPVSEFREWFILRQSKRVTPRILADLIRSLVEEHTVEHESGYLIGPLIVLDTANSNIDLSSENDNAEVGKAVAAIKENLKRGAVWVVAHTPKTLKRADVTQLSARGASAFEGDSNATAFIFKESDDPRDHHRYLSTDKIRFEAQFREIQFETQIGSETVMAPWGEMQDLHYRVAMPKASNPAARIAERERAKREEAAEKRVSLVDQVVDFVAEHGPISKRNIEQGIGGNAKEVREAILDAVGHSRLIESEKRVSGHPLLEVPGSVF